MPSTSGPGTTIHKGLNGIVNLDKPSGITSHDAVVRMKRILRVKKAGHTGTLDPMATGVLPICLNEATKITRFLLDSDKEYRVGAKLGEMTETADASGRTVETREVPQISFKELSEILSSFQGSISQVPPMYSAVKIRGEILYRLARRGEEIERPAREIQIHRIVLLDLNTPFFDFSVTCSKGTYVRTLCEDIGLKVGCGGHMTSLKRVRAGLFHLKDSVRFDDLEDPSGIEGKNFYLSADAALTGLREVRLTQADYEKAINGIAMRVGESELQENERIRLKRPSGELFGIGIVGLDKIKIERILHL